MQVKIKIMNGGGEEAIVLICELISGVGGVLLKGRVKLKIYAESQVSSYIADSRLFDTSEDKYF